MAGSDVCGNVGRLVACGEWRPTGSKNTKYFRSYGADWMLPKDQLERISQCVGEMVQEQYRILAEEVLPALEQEGVVIRRGTKDLSEAERRHLREVFRKEVFPVLTPLAIDPGHPFPHLLNKSLNLAVLLQRPRNQEKLFAVVQVPAVLPRFVALPPPAPAGGDGSSVKGHVFT